MKKAATDDSPRAVSLKEMPEINFDRYRIRRNPYAARIEREGAQLSHREPSKASLREMPEADFSHTRVRPNKYASAAERLRRSSTAGGVPAGVRKVVQLRRARSGFRNRYGRPSSRRRENAQPQCMPYFGNSWRLMSRT
jgi:hypothetical protein